MDWATLELSYVVYQDLRHEVKRSGVKADNEIERRATWIQNDSCFSLALLLCGREKMTAAEFCRKWRHEGYTKEECQRYVKRMRFAGEDAEMSPEEERDLRERVCPDLKRAGSGGSGAR